MKNKMFLTCLLCLLLMCGCSDCPRFDYGSMSGQSETLKLAVSDLENYVSHSKSRIKSISLIGLTACRTENLASVAMVKVGLYFVQEMT